MTDPIPSRAFDLHAVGNDAVVQQVDAMYGGGTSYSPGPRAELRQVGVVDAHASIAHGKISAKFFGVHEGYADPVIMRTRRGNLRISAHGDGRLVQPGNPTIYPVEVEIPFAIDHIDLDVIQLSRATLNDAARDLAPDATGPRLDRIAGLRQPYADAWWGALEQVRLVYSNDVLYDNDLIRESALKHLGAVTVVAFALADAPRDRVTRTARLVRKAERVMDENLDRPLTASSIARSCGVSIRALQLAFRAELGITPTDRLRDKRLRRTWNALVNADPTVDTVGAIAMASGFTHAGRFAAAYAAAYGEHPSQTLAR
ncbi:helix-turn-helix domain-containing protein [Microbacterium sp. AZCO]|uniref:helix-turn-helix domain-containing protein n=1 Tax=Microbacterium sp. AZCO TaxID=3142976 RepID=UPI0031F46E62